MSSTYFAFIAPWMMIFDILINLNTGYYDKGIPITKKSKIIINYLKNNIITDIVCVVPLITYFFKYESIYKYSNQDENIKILNAWDFM